MNTNTRKKQIKPKVTIDQDKVGIPKPKLASKIFSLFKIKINRKLFFWTVMTLIIALSTYLFLKSSPSLTSITIFSKDAISEQNKKINEIESLITENSKLIRDLEEKDQMLLSLEAQMMEMNSMLSSIARENEIISEANNELIDYLNSANENKIITPEDEIFIEDKIDRDNIQLIEKTPDPKIILDESEAEISESTGTDTINSLADKNKKKNITSIVMDRIKKNVASKRYFQNELELLVSIGFEDEDMRILRELSDQVILTPNELKKEFELLLKEDVILHDGENGLRSKFFDLLKNQISIKRKKRNQEYVLIEEIKANIYNDNLKEAILIIERLELDRDPQGILVNIKNRSLYLDEIKRLNEKYDLS